MRLKLRPAWTRDVSRNNVVGGRSPPWFPYSVAYRWKKKEAKKEKKLGDDSCPTSFYHLQIIVLAETIMALYVFEDED